MFFSNSGDEAPLAMLLGKENVAVSNGEVWRKQRRVSIYGYGGGYSNVKVTMLDHESSISSFSASQDIRQGDAILI